MGVGIKQPVKNTEERGRMSKDILIHEQNANQMSLEISDNQVGICISNQELPQDAWIFFKMDSEKDKQKMRFLISHLKDQLVKHEYPPYSTCAACSWLVREKGIKACEKHKETKT